MTYETGYCGAGHWAPQSADLHHQCRTRLFIRCLLMHHCTAQHCRSISVYQSVKLLCGWSLADDSSGTEEWGTTWCSDNSLFLNVSETTEHPVHLRTNNLMSYGHNNPQQALLFRKGLVKGKLPPGGFPKASSDEMHEVTATTASYSGKWTWACITKAIVQPRTVKMSACSMSAVLKPKWQRRMYPNFRS